MKLVRHYLESIDGIQVFPLISFVLFFTFFILIGIWVFRMKKGFIQEMSNAPLNDENED